MVGAAVQRIADQQEVAGLQTLKQHGGDGRHTAFEDSTGFCPVPERQSVLQNFHIRVVQAAVDQSCFFSIVLFAQAVGYFEESFPFLGRVKNKSGGLEDRTLDSAFRPFRMIAMRHHQGFRMQFSFHI